MRKISYAVQFLRGTPSTSWAEQERYLDMEMTTWEYFSSFLLDLIEDPENRILDALQAYQDAK